jgi:hypothetical protein
MAGVDESDLKPSHKLVKAACAGRNAMMTENDG